MFTLRSGRMTISVNPKRVSYSEFTNFVSAISTITGCPVTVFDQDYRFVETVQCYF